MGCAITIVPGGTYLFTVNTYRRQTFLTDGDVRYALREAIGTFRCPNYTHRVQDIGVGTERGFELDRPPPHPLPSGGGISHWTVNISSPPNGRGLRGGRSKIVASLLPCQGIPKT